MVSHVIVSRGFGKFRLTLSLTCIYGGKVHYVGGTTLYKTVIFPKEKFKCADVENTENENAYSELASISEIFNLLDHESI